MSEKWVVTLYKNSSDENYRTLHFDDANTARRWARVWVAEGRNAHPFAVDTSSYRRTRIEPGYLRYMSNTTGRAALVRRIQSSSETQTVKDSTRNVVVTQPSIPVTLLEYASKHIAAAIRGVEPGASIDNAMRYLELAKMELANHE